MELFICLSYLQINIALGERRRGGEEERRRGGEGGENSKFARVTKIAMKVV